MSRGPETRFIASVHRLLPDDLYWMKNHNTYVGGPADVWYSGDAADIWVEYKYVESLPPVIDLMDLKKDYCLSALQQEWLRDRRREGRKVFVILGCKEGGIMFANKSWERRHPRDEVKVMTRVELAKWIATFTRGSYEASAKRGKRVERCV